MNIYGVAVKTAEAWTEENVSAALATLEAFAPVALGEEGSNLTLVLSIGAESLGAACVAAEAAIGAFSRAGVLAIEATTQGETLIRAEEA